MAEVRWTPQAADDLEHIAEFIAADSEHYAGLVVSDIVSAVEKLSIFPESGRMVPELSDKMVREILLGNFRIIYRTLKNVIEILTIYHSSRLLDPDVIE